MLTPRRSDGSGSTVHLELDCLPWSRSHRLNCVLSLVLYPEKSESKMRRSLLMSRHGRRRISQRWPRRAPDSAGLFFLLRRPPDRTIPRSGTPRFSPTPRRGVFQSTYQTGPASLPLHGEGGAFLSPVSLSSCGARCKRFTRPCTPREPTRLSRI